MTNNIKYSWFLEQKGLNRVKRLQKKYHNKWNRVNTILVNSQTYSIELPEITKNIIKDKKDFYNRQMTKLHSFEYMFKQKGKDEAMKYIERLFSKEEVGRYKTNGILKILRKIF